MWGRIQSRGLTAKQPCPKDRDLSLGLRFNQNTASTRSRQGKCFMGEGRSTLECEEKE